MVDRYRNLNSQDTVVTDDSGAITGLQAGANAATRAAFLSTAQAAAVQALVSGAGVIYSPLIVATYNQPLTRSSINAAGDTTFTTMAAGAAASSFIIPGGSMGANGALMWEIEIGNNNTAAVVEFQLQIGGAQISSALTIAAGAANFYNMSHSWLNTAVTAQKYRGTYSKGGSSTNGFLTTAIDTSVDQTVNVVCRWQAAVPGGVVTLNRMRAWVEYGA